MKFKNNARFDGADHSPSSRRISSGWLISALLAIALAIVLLFVFAAPIGERFLEISRQSNPSAFRKAVSSFIELAASHTPRPTYTPLPSHTPYPTYTPFPTSTPTFTPTLTPTPTYTPTPTLTPTPTNTPTPTPIPPAAVLAHIHSEQKAELVVSEMQLSDRDFHVGIKDGLCSFGGDFNAVGKIEAGLDLTKLDEANVVYDSAKQEYTLKLPSPELTGCSIEYIRLIENSFTICNTDFDLLRRLGEVQAMRSFVDRAVERGIIGKAREQSALILEDLVRSFTGKQVITEFAASARTPRMDDSCKPRASSAYSYNRSRNIWSRH